MSESSITTTVSETRTCLQKHERIVLLLLVLIAGAWATNRVLSYETTKADNQRIAAVQQLNEQKANDAALAKQVSTLEDNYNALRIQYASEDAQLHAAQQQRAVALEQQQAADKVMSDPQLASRWAQLGNFDPSEVQASSAGFAVSSEAAHATVSALEEVPILSQNLKDETTVAQNNAAQVEQANGVISGLQGQVKSLQLTVADDDKACTATINDVKARDRKAKSKWFKVGFIGGFAVGFLTGHRL